MHIPIRTLGGDSAALNLDPDSTAHRARSALALLLLAILLVAFASARPLQGQAGAQVSAEVGALAQVWLLTTCGTGEGGIQIETLDPFASELEPLFLQALAEGPPGALVETSLRAAEARWKAREELLRGEVELGLSDADLEAASSESRQEYLDRSRRSFRASYRSQAAAALGQVGSERARKPLQAVASEEGSPVQAAAGLALARLQERLGAPVR